MLKGLQGDIQHLKAQNLLKYEYSMMLERQKTSILKEYMEGELGKID